MKKYFDRSSKKSAEPSIPSTNEQFTIEQLRAVEVLVPKLRNNPLFFLPVTGHHIQKLQAMDPEQRMAYILTTLTKEKSYISFPKPKEVRKTKSLYNRALKNLDKNMDKNMLQNQQIADNYRRVVRSIATITYWLQSPSIYDLRKSHEARREWREQMINIFDQGYGRNAVGPFTELYDRNIIAPNFSTSTLQNTIQLNLKQIGLEHPSSAADFDQLKQLTKKLREIPTQDVKGKVALITKQIRPVVFRILSKLATRPYQKTEPLQTQQIKQGGLQKANRQPQPKDDSSLPDWLREIIQKNDDTTDF